MYIRTSLCCLLTDPTHLRAYMDMYVYMRKCTCVYVYVYVYIYTPDWALGRSFCTFWVRCVFDSGRHWAATHLALFSLSLTRTDSVTICRNVMLGIHGSLS